MHQIGHKSGLLVMPTVPGDSVVAIRSPTMVKSAENIAKIDLT